MPKRRCEVVADRERRMSRLVDDEVWVPEEVRIGIKTEVMRQGVMGVLEETMEEDQRDSSSMTETRSSTPIDDAETTSLPPTSSSSAHRRPLPLRADSAPCVEAAAAPHRTQMARAMSLTFSLAAETEPVKYHDEDMPALPSSPLVIRKQKSLKKFFFPSTDELPIEEKRVEAEKKPKSLLSRARSKPSLRIDVEASNASPLSSLATASSSGQSDTFPDTPSSRSSEFNRGLSKRFSLSNMSGAFKKKAPAGGGLGMVPKVPELPEAYRQEKEAKLKESAVPISPVIGSTPLPADEGCRASTIREGHRVLMSPPIIRPAVRADDVESDTSSGFEFGDELQHADLMHVSPRTRRNPGVSLQKFLGTAPAPQVGVVVVPNMSRYSVQAIVVGPLLFPEGAEVPAVSEAADESPLSEDEAPGANRNGSDPDTSLESLSRSSSTSESDLAPITPNIPTPTGLSSPFELYDSPIPSRPIEITTTDTPPAPSPSTRSSTPKNRAFGSPDILLRLLSSSRSSMGREKHTPVPPPIPTGEEYSSLSGDVQLKSLHFEGLGLDFDGFKWDSRVRRA